MDPIANARDEIDKPDFLIKKKNKKNGKNTEKQQEKKWNGYLLFLSNNCKELWNWSLPFDQNCWYV